MGSDGLDKIRITGGKPLQGTISIQGSKNSALPMMAASLLHRGVSVLKGCPAIADVYCMEDILRSLGALTWWEKNTLYLDCSRADGTEVSGDSTGKMRSSVILLGALLARNKKGSMGYPGGCVIGKRPVDQHLYVLRCLGAWVEEKENSLEATKYEDGTYEIRADGQNETVIVGSVAYTGWKMIGVVPESVQAANYKNFRYYVFATILVLLVMLLEGNQLVSRKISKPIRELDASVKAHEAGGKPDIYIGGSSEIRHLGHSVQKSYEQIEELMDEIIRQQNERRKSELDALQSQINPHFLYNTLESITWMVEAQENEGAVRMISELAKLLRVSLSRGKTIISIKDELQHSRSYMNIQLARYKERFKTEFRIEKEIENYCIVKLVIQPILENAIYYGVGNMDEDEDGRIIVSGEKKEEDILITIEDNGMGMPEEVLEKILTDNSKVPKHGSGVGVINVHSRIRLMFGEKYGLSIESEPDEGTRVTIRIPAIPYTPENAERLESQKYIQRRSADEKESG